jgi:hypothetical protein
LPSALITLASIAKPSSPTRPSLMQRHSTLSNEKGALLSESDPGGNRTAVPCPGHLARVRTRRFKAAISE